jgi:hypothetical protein
MHANRIYIRITLIWITPRVDVPEGQMSTLDAII